MEKTETKRRKRKTLQITYPAPYSQSWNPDVLPVLMKNNVGRIARKRLFQSPRTWSQHSPDRPNPTAQHLKYGVFRNRRGSVPRPLIPKIDYRDRPKRKPLQDKQNRPKQYPNHVIKVPQVPNSKKNSNVAPKNPEIKKSNSKFPPVYVVRNTDKSNSRHLSQSKIMHMDIKPKRSLSPSFCPSPNFRSLSRKLSPRKIGKDFRLEGEAL